MALPPLAAWCLALLALAAAGPAAARSVSPLPAALANLTEYRGQDGVSYYFQLTGSSDGGVWGSGIYTDDSSVAAAAVHAGVLAVDETGVVKVTVLAGQASYAGSSANGVTSASYGTWSGSFRVEADDGGDNPTLADPGTLVRFRGMPGGVYRFQVSGQADAGTVWGTNRYTDDSSLAAAAVHAGVLANGESGVVRVVIGPAADRYLGSEVNGVASANYGYWDGSYAVGDLSGTVAPQGHPGGPDNPYGDPGSLTAYRGLDGGAYYFNLEGTGSGGIWGSEVYTDDSDLSTAAVHAGVLASGQTATVKVVVLPGQDAYTASTANGVTSSRYGAWSGSYRVAAPDGGLGTIPTFGGATQAAATEGSPFSLTPTVVGTATWLDATGLPEGLSFDGVSISGTPRVAGRFPLTLWAANGSGESSSTLWLDIGGDGTVVDGGTQVPDDGTQVPDSGGEVAAPCVATLSTELQLEVPAIEYRSGADSLWLAASFRYEPLDDGAPGFRVVGYSTINAPRVDCATATLSSQMALELPLVHYVTPLATLPLRASLQYRADVGVVFELTDFAVQQ
ncbi:hypothetical protein JCM17961_20710 [Endothiovibrio diazotrophicus]